MSKITSHASENPYMNLENHKKYLERIKKTLYYARFPKTERLSLPVTELASELFSEVHRGKSLQRLHCDDASSVSRNACVSPCSLVLALLYLERLKISNPEYLERTAPSDLFLVSLMVSSKFLFDDGLSDEVFMDEWAASGDISIKELVQLERDFLSAIDWKIYVSELNFWKKLNEIEITIAGRESRNRGFCTYTELNLLSRTIHVFNLLHEITIISLVLAATYTLGVLSIAGSAFLTSQIPGTSLYYSQKKINIESIENQTVSVPCGNISDNETYIETETIARDISNFSTDSVPNDSIRFKCNMKPIDALNVFKTGLFLASITPFSSDWCNKTDGDTNATHGCESDVQYVDWDWWTVPSMNWLTKISEVVENFTLPILNHFTFVEISAINGKAFELEDHINKATKTRIQDQLESSWHKEWTDTIYHGVFVDQPFVHTVKKLFQYME